MAFHVPERFRRPDLEKWHMAKRGFIRPEKMSGEFGIFVIPTRRKNGHDLRCIASSGAVAGDPQIWEHVSVSRGFPGKNPVHLPTWDDMGKVKATFWDPEDCVIQYHPRASEYVNENEYVLHLWRPLHFELPEPPSIMVGRK